MNHCIRFNFKLLDVVGISGGPDSAAMLAYLNQPMNRKLYKIEDMRLVHFHSRRVSAAVELKAARLVADHFGMELNLVDLSNHPEFGAVMGRGDSDIVHWSLFSIRAAVALMKRWPDETINFNEAYHAGDLDSGFIVPVLDDQVKMLVREGSRGRVQLSRPVIRMSKKSLIERHESAVPFHLTYSCVRGGAEHCGECGACLARFAVLSGGGNG